MTEHEGRTTTSKPTANEDYYDLEDGQEPDAEAYGQDARESFFVWMVQHEGPAQTVAGRGTRAKAKAKAKAQASSTPSSVSSQRFRPETCRAPDEFDVASLVSGMSYEPRKIRATTSPTTGLGRPEDRTAEAAGWSGSEGRSSLGPGAVQTMI